MCFVPETRVQQSFFFFPFLPLPLLSQPSVQISGEATLLFCFLPKNIVLCQTAMLKLTMPVIKATGWLSGWIFYSVAIPTQDCQARIAVSWIKNSTLVSRGRKACDVFFLPPEQFGKFKHRAEILVFGEIVQLFFFHSFVSNKLLASSKDWIILKIIFKDAQLYEQK